MKSKLIQSALKRSYNARGAPQRPPPGSKPGTLKRHPSAKKTKIVLTIYDKANINIEKINEASELSQVLTLEKDKTVWINVIGLGNLNSIKEIGEIFSLHPLILEDVVHVYQRPKIEHFDNGMFVAARLKLTEPNLKDEQISFFLGDHFVISFLETGSLFFEKIIERLNNPHSTLRHSKADYLFYELLDTTVDSYFPMLQIYSDAIDKLEDDIILKPNTNELSHIHNLRQNIIRLKRDAWSQRNALGELYRNEKQFISAKTSLYFRDCYDHTVQIIDLTENSLDRSASLIDIYLSSNSQRLNEIMKVLTIIATIFMPLSFFAGIWGMNFVNMPELEWKYGYQMAMGVMVLVAALLVYYFWKQGWIKFRQSSDFKKKNSS